MNFSQISNCFTEPIIMWLVFNFKHHCVSKQHIYLSISYSYMHFQYQGRLDMYCYDIDHLINATTTNYIATSLRDNNK